MDITGLSQEGVEYILVAPYQVKISDYLQSGKNDLESSPDLLVRAQYVQRPVGVIDNCCSSAWRFSLDTCIIFFGCFSLVTLVLRFFHSAWYT